MVRTKAEPLPGFTCWNSMISKGSPSTSIFMPLRNSDVSMTPAMGGPLTRGGPEWEGPRYSSSRMRGAAIRSAYRPLP